MYVMIVGCDHPMKWYSSLYCYVVAVRRIVGDEFECRDTNGHINYITRADAVVLKKQ